MKPTIFFNLAIILSVLLAACGGTAPQAQTLPAGPTRSNEPPVTEAAPATTVAPAAPELPPLQVAVALDESATAEALIPLEGGQLILETSDGARYTLEIPGDALSAPVRVRMTGAQVTPLEPQRGLTFAESSYAVHLEPEGLFFNNFATLTIETPSEIPLEEQIFFGYQSASGPLSSGPLSGQDLFLAPPEPAAREMKILLSHFSGYGVTKGLLADIEPVRARLGGSEEARLQSQVAEYITRQRQKMDDGADEVAFTEEFEQLVREFYEKVVAVRVAAAGESCAAGRLAVETAIGFVRQMQLLGFEADYTDLDLAALLETASRACLQEEYALCVEQHVIHRMIPVWLSFERQSQLLGSSTPENPSELSKEARRLTEQCLTFELEFESSGETMDPALGFAGRVSANVPLRFDADDLKISGSGTLVNEFSEVYAEECTVNFSVTDGTFTAFDLIYETDLPDADSIPAPGDAEPEPEKLGKVTSLTLEYFPGAPSGPLSVICDGNEIAGSTGTAWFTSFMFAHEDEQSFSETGLRYTAKDWTVLGGELFAERSWTRERAELETNEQGSMTLYHRPGE